MILGSVIMIFDSTLRLTAEVISIGDRNRRLAASKLYQRLKLRVFKKLD
jgi:hypothetical protein